MMNASEENTTYTLVESVATTQATTPPIKPITKVLVPSGNSMQYPIIKTGNIDVPIDDTTKENTALPAINRAALLSPKTVADKYPKLLVRSKIPTLAVKLANKAFWAKSYELLYFSRSRF